LLVFILLFSLYLTKVEVEGDFIIDSTNKKEFTDYFSNRSIEIHEVIDSLFKIYEEAGFFNVKFDVTIDSLKRDTIGLEIKPIISRIPVINEVQVEGFRLPEPTIYTYFPFKEGIFRRSMLMESFGILRNAGKISDAKYFFLRLSKTNSYRLLVKLQPYREAFYVNLTGNSRNGISGTMSFAHPSILSSGMGFDLSAGLSDGGINYYSAQSSVLLPYVKGMVLTFAAIQIPGNSMARVSKGEVSYWKKNGGITVGAGKSNAELYSFLELSLNGRSWREGLRLRKGKGWSFSYILVFNDVLGVKVEQSLVLSNVMHYLILNKPLRVLQIPLYPDKLFTCTTIGLSVPLKEKLALFADAGALKKEYWLDMGISYTGTDYGIYLGYSMDAEVRRVNVGLVLGNKNFMFERSMRIL